MNPTPRFVTILLLALALATAISITSFPAQGQTLPDTCSRTSDGRTCYDYTDRYLEWTYLGWSYWDATGTAFSYSTPPGYLDLILFQTYMVQCQPGGCYPNPYQDQRYIGLGRLPIEDVQERGPFYPGSPEYERLLAAYPPTGPSPPTPPDPPQDSGDQEQGPPRDPDDCSKFVGSPVNVTSGNMYTQQEDLAYPSAFGRFSFTRTYNSQAKSQGLLQTTPLGVGWTHPYEYELRTLGPSTVRVRNGAGQVRYYHREPGSPDTFKVSMPARDSSTVMATGEGYVEREQNGTRREFDRNGRLLQIVTREGWVTTLTYTGGTQLSSVTDPGGRTLTLSYAGDRLTRVEGPGGHFAEYGYDPHGRLVSVRDAIGLRWQYVYGAPPSPLTGVLDGNGNWVETHSYDGRDRVILTTGQGLSKPLTIEYLSDTQSRVTDGQGRSTTYTFGSYGGSRRISRIDGPCPCGRPDSSMAYDADGRLITRTDGRGNTTAFAYDAGGNLVSITDALGQTTTSTYNAFGQVQTTTDPAGATTSFEYDAVTGILLRTVDALGHATTITPDARNLPATITDARGSATTIAYGPDGLPVSRTDATGATTTFAYDPAGRLVQVTDALGGKTAFTYDARGRLLSTTDPLGAVTSFAYDAAGNRLSQTDAMGRVTAFAYDAANRLVSTTDPAGQVTRYTYDSEGNLLTVTDAKNQTTGFAYDAYDRVVQRTDPLGAIETFTYDAAGNLTSRTDRKGQTLAFAYDALNRLTMKTLPDTSTLTYAYDPLGRLLSAADSRVPGSLAFTYDPLGRVLSTTDQAGRQLTATYDAVGNRVGLQDETGSVSQFAYDPQNRLASLTDPRTGTFGFTYDAMGRRLSLTRPNGTATDYAYDPASRLLSLQHDGTRKVLEDLTYAYDPVGNRLGDTRNGLEHQYAYDPLDQLTEVTRKAGRRMRVEETYAYDPVGNRMTAGAQVGFVYDAANRLTADAEHTYAYDANGNLIQKVDLKGGITNYTYDAEDRLVHVVSPTAEVGFEYDPLGRRSAKVVLRWDGHEPATVEYVYDGEDILATFSDLRTLNARYTHGPGIDEPLARTHRRTVRYYHADVLGTIIALSEEQGQEAGRYSYAAFGEPRNRVDDPQPYRFTGREWDPEIGLYYYRARYLDAQTGRFLQEDPIGFRGGLNSYVYVANDPLNSVDFWGLQGSTIDVQAAIVSGVVAGIAGAIVGGSAAGAATLGVGAIPGAIVGGVVGGISGFAGSLLIQGVNNAVPGFQDVVTVVSYITDPAGTLLESIITSQTFGSTPPPTSTLAVPPTPSPICIPDTLVTP